MTRAVLADGVASIEAVAVVSLIAKTQAFRPVAAGFTNIAVSPKCTLPVLDTLRVI